MQTETPLSQSIPLLQSASPASSLEALCSHANLQPWLQLNTSLTKELQHTFASKPGLILLGEGLEAGEPWECELLATHLPVYTRHIALTIENVPVVLARSVTTQGSGMNALRALETRPLAELLFEDARWQKQAEERYLTLPNNVPGRGRLWQNQQLGARLIVQEFFLPTLTEKICA